VPATTFIGHFLGPDIHTNRPAATGLPNGTMYVCTTDNKIERVVSGVWADYATLGSGTTGALTLLSTTTLAADGTFDISSISGAYNDLILNLVARSTVASANDSPLLRFNNDSAANYNHTRLYSTSGSAQAFDGRGGTSVTLSRVPGSTALTSKFGAIEALIPGYTSTTWHKLIMWRAFEYDTNAAGGLAYFDGGADWSSTSAINRIQIQNSAGGNLLAGSQLRIYGRT